MAGNMDRNMAMNMDTNPLLIASQDAGRKGNIDCRAVKRLKTGLENPEFEEWSSGLSSSSSSCSPPQSSSSKTMSPINFRYNVLSVVINCACCEGHHPQENFIKGFAARLPSRTTFTTRLHWWQAVLRVHGSNRWLQGVDLVNAITDKIIEWTQQKKNHRDIVENFFK